MSGLSAQQSARYLAAVADLSSGCRFYDCHVHPYEVLFDRFSYQQSAHLPGVVSVPGRQYTPPYPAPLHFPVTIVPGSEERSQRLIDISVMLLKKNYGSVGPAVFLDHMKLSGVERVLLLPVAAETDDAQRFETRLQWVCGMYGGDERFSIAGSIPATVWCDEIEPFAARLKRCYGIKALKCHPVVTGIDLGSSARKGWMEVLLESCRNLQLPLILHGGRNNPYWGGSRGNFGSLAQLRDINFSLSSHPVILAHAGFHNCVAREVAEEGVPLLKRMLEKHPNLYVDISALGFEQLKLVFAAVDRERILFGSDALYLPQWESVATAVHALQELGPGWEESFVRFASLNPAATLFAENGQQDREVCHVQSALVSDAGDPRSSFAGGCRE